MMPTQMISWMFAVGTALSGGPPSGDGRNLEAQTLEVSATLPIAGQ
jgi:hypothetical protein